MPAPLKNPPNPWSASEIDWEGEAPPASLEVYEERAKSIVSSNVSPDLPFRYSVNPYRGCFHGCAYCYARSSHQYWGFGAGTDFERKIVVKVNAVDLLRQVFEKKSWKGEVLVFSGNTDCYQPIEASYRITRRMLELCNDYKNPVSIISKSTIMIRDLDLLVELSKRTALSITLSIAFEDDETGRKIEPWAPLISKRFQTLKTLSEAGIRTGISLAPIIPGLNDAHLPNILKRAKDNGAQFAFTQLVRLSGEVLPVFQERIEQVVPLRAKKIEHAIEEMRGGKMSESEFGKRQVGKGERWKVISDLFDQTAERLGFAHRNERDQMVPADVPSFSRPQNQLSLAW